MMRSCALKTSFAIQVGSRFRVHWVITIKIHRFIFMAIKLPCCDVVVSLSDVAGPLRVEASYDVCIAPTRRSRN